MDEDKYYVSIDSGFWKWCYSTENSSLNLDFVSYQKLLENKPKTAKKVNKLKKYLRLFNANRNCLLINDVCCLWILFIGASRFTKVPKEYI